MNWYWTIGGALAVIGGLAHAFLGEWLIVRPLDPTKLDGHPKMPGDSANFSNMIEVVFP